MKAAEIEEVRAGREDDGGVRTRIQESSEGKWLRGKAVGRGVQAGNKAEELEGS